MLHSMMAHLSQQGWDASAVVTDDPNAMNITVDGVRVLRYTDKEQIHNLVRDTDLILTHLSGSTRAKILGRIHRKPAAQVIHNTSFYTEGFIGSGCDFAIYNSEWVKEHHESIRNQAMIRVLQPDGQSYDFMYRKCFSWPSMVLHPPVIEASPGHGAGPNGRIALLNLVPNKGPDVFYEVARRNLDLSFLAVKGGYEPGNQVVEQLPNVSVVEHDREVSNVYKRCSVILMPSKYESYGLVAVEAIGRGIPAVVAGTPGLKEAMGPSGIYCDRDDIASWTAAIRGILADYDAASSSALGRYKELYESSQSEMVEFELNMRRLVDEWPSSPSLI